MKRNDGTVKKRAEIVAQAEQIERDLGSIRRALRKPLEVEVAKGNLTVPQTDVMRIVVRSQGISLKDLSHAVSLAHSTVSGIVDRLEKRGMIDRRQDEADGRVTRIFPTAAVSEFVQEKIPALARRPLETALEHATNKERTEISAAIRRLRELLEPISRVAQGGSI
jgi:DNA-binding MarR family transcriptional regulator